MHGTMHKHMQAFTDTYRDTDTYTHTHMRTHTQLVGADI